MILVTIGMNDSPYEKMFQIIDDLAPTLGEEVVIQTGPLDFVAKNCRTLSIVPDDQMQKLYDESSLIIAHAGIGTIVNGLKRNIPLVLIPRTVVCDVDKDQQQLVADKIVKMGRGVCVSKLEDLEECIGKARKMVLSPYVKDDSLCRTLSTILQSIDESIKSKKKRQK